MADNIQNVPISRGEWVDLYAATGITVGEPIAIENIGAFEVRLAVSPTQPLRTHQSFNVISRNGEILRNTSGDSGAWAYSNNVNAEVAVRAINSASGFYPELGGGSGGGSGFEVVGVKDAANTRIDPATEATVTALRTLLESIESGQLANNHNVAVSNQVAQPVQDGGTVNVGNQPTDYPLPSGQVSALIPQTDGLTDAQLRAGDVGVDTGLTQPTTPSDTQPVSAASLPLPTGAATAAGQLPDNHQVTVSNHPAEYPLPDSQVSTLTPQTDALTDAQLRASALTVADTDSNALLTAADGYLKWKSLKEGDAATFAHQFLIDDAATAYTYHGTALRTDAESADVWSVMRIEYDGVLKKRHVKLLVNTGIAWADRVSGGAGGW